MNSTSLLAPSSSKLFAHHLLEGAVSTVVVVVVVVLRDRVRGNISRGHRLDVFSWSFCSDWRDSSAVVAAGLRAPDTEKGMIVQGSCAVGSSLLVLATCYQDSFPSICQESIDGNTRVQVSIENQDLALRRPGKKKGNSSSEPTMDAKNNDKCYLHLQYFQLTVCNIMDV